MAQQQSKKEPNGQGKQGPTGNKKSREWQDLGRKPRSHKKWRIKEGR